MWGVLFAKQNQTKAEPAEGQSHLMSEISSVSEESRSRSGPKVIDPIFRRLIRCGLCGYSLIADARKNHIYYRCHTRDCLISGVSEEAIESVVTLTLRRLSFSNAEKRRLAKQIAALRSQTEHEQQQELTNLYLKQRQLTEGITGLVESYLRGAVNRELFRKRRKALLFERRVIEVAVEHSLMSANRVLDEVEKIVAVSETIYSSYRSAGVKKKRRVLKLLTSSLTVDQERITFALVAPFREISKRADTYEVGVKSPDKSHVEDDLLIQLSEFVARNPYAALRLDVMEALASDFLDFG